MCKADMQNKNTIDNIFRFEMCILMIDINNYQKNSGQSKPQLKSTFTSLGPLKSIKFKPDNYSALN